MPERAYATHLPLRLDTQATWVQALVCVGMAGFLMIMAQLSFPLRWTPVPFSMMPFALLVAGAAQRPLWAGLSVVIYLVAGAVGLPVFAEASAGWRHIVGGTGGYLLGFPLVSVFLSWYMGERRAMLPRKWIGLALGGAAVLTVGGLVAIASFMASGRGFSDIDGMEGWNPEGWGVTSSILWLLVFFTTAVGAVSVWGLRRVRSDPAPALNLFLVMLAAIGVLHLCGVAGLVVFGGAPLFSAVILGSAMFIPFDIVKAGLAVGLLMPFLPAPSEAPDEDSHA